MWGILDLNAVGLLILIEILVHEFHIIGVEHHRDHCLSHSLSKRFSNAYSSSSEERGETLWVPFGASWSQVILGGGIEPLGNIFLMLLPLIFIVMEEIHIALEHGSLGHLVAAQSNIFSC